MFRNGARMTCAPLSASMTNTSDAGPSTCAYRLLSIHPRKLELIAGNFFASPLYGSINAVKNCSRSIIRSAILVPDGFQAGGTWHTGQLRSFATTGSVVS